MIYEFRIYETVPGKVDALVQRFKKVNMPVLKKHGIKLIGVWIPQEKDQFAYMVAFESEEHRTKAWQAFNQDPDFRGPYDEENRTDKVFNRTPVRAVLSPTDYSPMV